MAKAPTVAEIRAHEEAEIQKRIDKIRLVEANLVMIPTLARYEADNARVLRELEQEISFSPDPEQFEAIIKARFGSLKTNTTRGPNGRPTSDLFSFNAILRPNGGMFRQLAEEMQKAAMQGKKIKEAAIAAAAPKVDVTRIPQVSGDGKPQFWHSQLRDFQPDDLVFDNDTPMADQIPDWLLVGLAEEEGLCKVNGDLEMDALFNEYPQDGPTQNYRRAKDRQFFFTVLALIVARRHPGTIRWRHPNEGRQCWVNPASLPAAVYAALQEEHDQVFNHIMEHYILGVADRIKSDRQMRQATMPHQWNGYQPADFITQAERDRQAQLAEAQGHVAGPEELAFHAQHNPLIH